MKKLEEINQTISPFELVKLLDGNYSLYNKRIAEVSIGQINVKNGDFLSLGSRNYTIHNLRAIASICELVTNDLSK